ncbi:MAG: DUF4301 family protein [Syntrophobacteraceae bacterium]|nr:DUF4301 family protein [Syntrophobacteraceae bacterium]
MKLRFTDADHTRMKSMGITPACVLDQIDTLRRSEFFVRLLRPCTLLDGIRKIGDAEMQRYMGLHDSAARRGRFTKFVPASGAATRMFQSLLNIFYVPQYLEKDELQKRVNQGVSIACDFKRFIDELERFPFIGDLRKALVCDGHSLEELLRTGRFRTLLEYLLTQRGTNYGNLPKAMLLFHSYPGENRTAFEEQLGESPEYLGSDRSSVHFTIAEDHLAGFLSLQQKVCPRWTERCGANFNVSFSFQKSSTNTIALDMNGMPFRDRLGRLHFRPAGHGALIENLGERDADLIYIKNVDNVVPDRLKGLVHLWKKVLGGCLVSIQDAVHALLRRLTGPDWARAVPEATLFASRELLWGLPAGFETWPEDRKRSFLLHAMDRPIRVCGVVPNAGEPGGAPFWVEDANGVHSIQIVEKAQVNVSSREQRNAWNSSTHFNPVDIVCGVRNFEGKSCDLKKFIDPHAVIITRKSIDGADVHALELPGLWNGSMARWISVFVEVPQATFNPVKSVFDLLRPEHQPDEQ